MNSPRKIGGIRVPKAAQRPSTTAIPKDNPRYRMVKPKVRPPTPHSSPKKNVQKRTLPGVSRKTASRSLVLSRPKNHGAMIQLKKPPVSQNVSHAHRFTPRYGT